MEAVMWRPDPERIENSNMAAFEKAWLGGPREDGPGLRRAALDDPEGFWRALWSFGDLDGDLSASPALELGPEGGMLGSRWFPKAKINWARAALGGGRALADDAPALIFRGEDGARREVSWSDLRAESAALAAALSARGIGAGDRVAALTPNAPEAVIGLLACATIGAIWSSCSPDFGAAGALDRFGQIEPKALIAADGYHWAGKRIELAEKTRAIAAGLPGLTATIVYPLLGDAEIAGERWEDTIAPHRGAPPRFVDLPFDHPLYVLYSSGTTGKPKAIVHGAGGALLQHYKEHALHCDVKPGDVVFYFTTCGWMMWNWLVGGLAAGATLVLWDGSPFHPSEGALWRMASEERVKVFGASAKFVDACKKAGWAPRGAVDLSSIETILSTGSPLLPESFDYLYETVAPHAQVASISGGTDIVSCFVLGDPTLPVRRGEIQGAGLGLAVEIWSENGERVIGEKGQLVCTEPFPTMPVGFWGDRDGSRYREAYFAYFPGIWNHGDFAEETPSGGFVIHGRSDAVLNPGGVRIGTAEIYRQVEQAPEVLEAVCVGQDWEGDVRVVLFVRLADGVSLDPTLIADLKSRIRAGASPRHVPAKILAVPDIPRTRSGKITELAVRDVVHGRPVKNTEALANPEALAHFAGLDELGR